jgi:hypothetical protein
MLNGMVELADDELEIIVVAYTEATGRSPMDQNPALFPPAVTVGRNMDISGSVTTVRLRPPVISLFRQTVHFPPPAV